VATHSDKSDPGFVRDLQDRLDAEQDPVKQADLRQQIADARAGRSGTAQPGSQQAPQQ
jgi:hypothetical protein